MFNGLKNGKKSKMNEVVGEFCAGWIAGAAGLTVGFPLDSVKVLMQTSSSPSSSFVSQFSRVVRQRGVTALFDGVASPLVSYGVLVALNFTVYSSVARRLESDFPSAPRFLMHGAAGLVSGAVLSFASCPFELTKIILQSAAADKTNRSPHLESTVACAKHIWRTRGVRGFYRGQCLPINLLTLSVGSGVYFASYDGIRGKFDGSPFVVGGLTGLVYWLSIFGLDSLKTRVMADAARPTPQFSSIRQCYLALKQERGSLRRVLFGPGLSAALVRAVPVNAVMLGTFSFVQELRKKHFS